MAIKSAKVFMPQYAAPAGLNLGCTLRAQSSKLAYCIEYQFISYILYKYINRNKIQ